MKSNLVIPLTLRNFYRENNNKLSLPKKSDEENLKSLVQRGIVDLKNSDESLGYLVNAIANNNQTALAFLLSNGAKIDAIDKSGNTLLHRYFQETQNLPVDTSLLKQVNINRVNSNGQTILSLILESKNEKALNEIIKIETLDPNVSDAVVQTLIQAITQNQVSILKTLAFCKIKPKLFNRTAYSDELVIQSCALGNIEIVKILLENYEFDLKKLNRSRAIQSFANQLSSTLSKTTEILVIESFKLIGVSEEEAREKIKLDEQEKIKQELRNKKILHMTLLAGTVIGVIFTAIILFLRIPPTESNVTKEANKEYPEYAIDKVETISNASDYKVFRVDLKKYDELKRVEYVYRLNTFWKKDSSILWIDHIPESQYTLIFDDDFLDNKNKWDLKDYELRIEDGYYKYRTRSVYKKDNISNYNDNPINIDNTKSHIIKIHFFNQISSKPTDEVYRVVGFYWTNAYRGDLSTYFKFSDYDNKDYISIYQSSPQGSQSIFETKVSNAVHYGYNNLTLDSENNSVKVYLNGEFITRFQNTVPIRHLGFVAENGSNLDVDRIMIYEKGAESVSSNTKPEESTKEKKPQETPKPIEQKTPEPTPKYVASGIIDTKAGLRLRSGAGANYPKIDFLYYQTKFKILDLNGPEETIDGVQGKWMKIEYNRKTGWIFGGFVRLE